MRYAMGFSIQFLQAKSSAKIFAVIWNRARAQLQNFTVEIYANLVHFKQRKSKTNCILIWIWGKTIARIFEFLVLTFLKTFQRRVMQRGIRGIYPQMKILLLPLNPWKNGIRPWWKQSGAYNNILSAFKKNTSEKFKTKDLKYILEKLYKTFISNEKKYFWKIQIKIRYIYLKKGYIKLKNWF